MQGRGRLISPIVVWRKQRKRCARWPPAKKRVGQRDTPGSGLLATLGFCFFLFPTEQQPVNFNVASLRPFQGNG